MKEAITQDKRPAIAFDNKQEVLHTIMALKIYRDEHGIDWNQDGSEIMKLIEEYEKALELFNK